MEADWLSSYKRRNIFGMWNSKKEDSLYLVHMAKCDLKYDYDNTNPEFYSYSNLEDAIAYIVSRGFPFDEFKPQKGNKIFDINDPRFPNLDEN